MNIEAIPIVSRTPKPSLDAEPRGSGRIVSDFDSFCEGDIDPTLNKRIRVLIDSYSSYIVYLDEDLSPEWSATSDYGEMPDGFAEVANRIGHLETQSKGLLRESQIEPFARLLAEAMARILGENDHQKSAEILAHAEAYLKARSIENARIWYIGTAGILLIILCVIAAVLWIYREPSRNLVGDDAFDGVLGAIFGSIGAVFSIVTRTKSIEVDAAAGKPIHILESSVRIASGGVGAILVALAVKTNLVLGIAKSFDHSVAALLAICIVAGTSERVVPSLIKRVEGSVSAHPATIKTAQRSKAGKE